MSRQRAAVRGDAQRADVPQMPRDADVVVRALLVQLRRAHHLERRAAQEPLAVRRRAVAEVELRVGEQIGDAQPDAARGDAHRRRERPDHRRRLVAAIDVPGGEAIDDEVAGGGAGVLRGRAA